MTFNHFFGLVVGFAAVTVAIWKFGFLLPIIIAVMIYSHKEISRKR